MNSSIFKLDGICVVTISEDEFYDDDIGMNLLQSFKEYRSNKVVIDISFLKFLQSADITRMDYLSKLFGLNNIKSIFCGLNERSICTVVHFIDNFSFKTAISVDAAIDDLKN